MYDLQRSVEPDLPVVSGELQSLYWWLVHVIDCLLAMVSPFGRTCADKHDDLNVALYMALCKSDESLLRKDGFRTY